MRHGQSVVSVNPLRFARVWVGTQDGLSWTQRLCPQRGGGFRWPRLCFRTMASPSALGASLGARASIHSGLVTNARENLFRFLQIANDFDTSQCSEFGSPVDSRLDFARFSAI